MTDQEFMEFFANAQRDAGGAIVAGYESPEEEQEDYGCKPYKCAGCMSRGLWFCEQLDRGGQNGS